MNIKEQIREKIEAGHFAKGSDYTTDDIVIDVMEIIKPSVKMYKELVEIRNKTLTASSDDVSLQDILQMLQYKKQADDWNGEEYNLFIDLYILEINGNTGVDNVVFYDLSKPTSEQKPKQIENIINLLTNK